MATTMKIGCFSNVLLVVMLIVFCYLSTTAAAATETAENSVENEPDNHPSDQPQRHKTYLRSLSFSFKTATSASSTTTNSLPVVLGWGEEKEKEADDAPENSISANGRTRSSGSITTASTTTTTTDEDWDTEERIIVQCKPGTEEKCLRQITSTGQTVNVVHQLPGTDFFALKVKKSVQHELSLLSDVDALELDPIRRPFTTTTTTTKATNEQDRKRPRSLETGTTAGSSQQITPYGVDLVQARQVWSTYGITGQNVKVCVIDTGLKLHDDLNSNSNNDTTTTTTTANNNNNNNNNNNSHSPPRTVNGWANKLDLPWDQDGAGHGTHVAGIIAATDNDLGVVGVAPDVDIYVTRVFDDEGEWYASDIEAAAQACRAAGAHIINMSLGGPDRSLSEEAIFKSLYLQGILLIAASGNGGEEEENPVNFPAAYDTVMGVGSVGATKEIDPTSTYNEHVNIVAPGVQIESLNNDGTSLIKHSGTSMACPHATGVAALLKSYKPEATPSEIMDVLQVTAEDLGPQGKDDHYGYGLINAFAAMSQWTGGPPPPPADCIPLEVTVKTDSFGWETSWELRLSNDNRLAFVGASLPSDETVVLDYCIPKDCYTFQINDAYGDGMENGSYEVKYNGDIVLTGTGNFAYHGETKQMGCCSGNCQGQSSSSSSPLPSNGGDGEGDDDDLIVGDGDGDDSTPAPSPLVPADENACVSVNFSLTTDAYAKEEGTRYQLTNLNQDVIIWDMPTLSNLHRYTESSCLNLQSSQNEEDSSSTSRGSSTTTGTCYMLYAFDGFGDGLSDAGDNKSIMELSLNGVTVYSGANFGSSLAVPIGTACGSCIPLVLSLKADQYVVEEKSRFYLQEQGNDGTLVWDVETMEAAERYDHTACLDPDKCYHFVMDDLFNDGIGDPMTLTYGGVVLEGSSRFISLGRGCNNP